MTSQKPIEILVDAGHNEELILEEPELSQLVTLLKKNGISAHSSSLPIAQEDISKFQVVVLGNPLDSSFSPQEISALVSFVEGGGGLLLFSGATIFGKGGDAARNTNLNMITKHFDFEFSEKAIELSASSAKSDSVTADELISAIPAAQHPVVHGIRHLLFTTGTSIKTETTSNQLFRAASCLGSPVMVVATSAKEGRVLAIGGTTPLFNEHISIEDHEVFIIQAIRWLASSSASMPVARIVSESSVDSNETRQAIADLRQQLNHIERELETLKEVINTSLKEMEEVLQQFQQEEDES